MHAGTSKCLPLIIITPNNTAENTFYYQITPSTLLLLMHPSDCSFLQSATQQSNSQNANKAVPELL